MGGAALEAGEQQTNVVVWVGDFWASAGQGHDGGAGWEVVRHCEVVVGVGLRVKVV